MEINDDADTDVVVVVDGGGGGDDDDDDADDDGDDDLKELIFSMNAINKVRCDLCVIRE